MIEMMKEQGWVTRSEFCKLIGRVDGGSILEFARDNGVRAVMVDRNGNGEVWMFRPEDAIKCPPIEPRDGNDKGGKLTVRISNLRIKVEELLARVKVLEEFKRSLE